MRYSNPFTSKSPSSNTSSVRTNRGRFRMTALAIGAVVALVPFAGCSDDDTTATDDTATEDTASSNTEDGATEHSAFCGQAFATDATVTAAQGGEEPDPAAIQEAEEQMDALAEAAPDDVADTVSTVVRLTKEQFTAEDGPPDEELVTSWAAMIDWMADNCGYNVVDVTAKDYAFEGLPADVDAGPTIVRFSNQGEEVHEIAFAKRKDGTTEPLEELLALPEEEAGEKVEFMTNGFAMPGGAGGALLDLDSGGYIAVCFIPTGMTPDAMAAAMSGGTMPEGAPHAMQGMTGEFTVS